METPRIERIKNGWAAYGQGWAVKGESPEDAECRFREAERKHLDIASRPLPSNIGLQPPS